MFEDFEKGLGVQTYYALPQALRPIFGLHVLEHQFTHDGALRGRRLSLYRSSDPTLVRPETRLAFFVFVDQGVLERYQINQDPKTWFKAGAASDDEERSEDEKFFYELLAPLASNPGLLGMPLILSRSKKAPIGFMSPMIIRPIYQLKQRGGGGSSQMVMKISRSYNQDGKLVELWLSLEQLGLDSEGRLTESLFRLPSDPKVIEGEQTSRLLETAKPCSRLLNELRQYEGKPGASED